MIVKKNRGHKQRGLEHKFSFVERFKRQDLTDFAKNNVTLSWVEININMFLRKNFLCLIRDNDENSLQHS